MALVRLCEHPNPDEVVRQALANGHVTLPPVGGWPSQRERSPPKASAHEQRQEVARAIFGDRSNGNGAADSGGRDISGEAVRL